MISSGYESEIKSEEKPLRSTIQQLKTLTVSDNVNNNEQVNGNSSSDDMSEFNDSISQVAFRRLEAKFGELSFFEQVRRLGFQSLDFLNDWQRTEVSDDHCTN